MNETFISHGPDGAAVARTLADFLARSSLAPILWHGEAANAAAAEAAHERMKRSARVVLIMTQDWAALCWPALEIYLASASEGSAALLAKLVLVDLSSGASVPALLRPLLKTGFTLKEPGAPDYASIVHQMVAPVHAAAKPSSCREVFVLGHPGSGKSAFCAFLGSHLAGRGVPVRKIDAYSYLQALFRLDQLRGDTTRFAADALCEFVITDGAALDESVSLVKSRLLARDPNAKGITIVELAFSEGQALADVIDSCPVGLIVQIDASLANCQRRNAARGAILAAALQSAASSDEAFDHDSDVHYVPAHYYDRYAADPARWAEGPSLLSRRFGARVHRLENRDGNLRGYAAACDAFIEAVVLPFFDEGA